MRGRGAWGGRPALSRLATAVTGAIAMTVGLAAVAPASAAVAAAVTVATRPEPSRRELTARQKELSEQAERLSEQYNGLRVRLQQAQRASKVGKDNARRHHEALEAVRAKVASVAADSYKNGVVDPSLSFASSADPQAVLDRSATLNFFARQNGTQVAMLLQTMQAAERARRSAEERANEVGRLADEAKRKRRHLQAQLKKVERQLGGPASPSRPGPLPDIAPGGASAKALGAVQAALGRLGTPYSWGGGNASGPTYGTAQGRNIKGFDCSGLTLYAYAQVGIGLPHYTGSQFNAGTRVSQSQLKPGDLVFFYADLHHMGMYIGGGRMVHAPQTGDVVKISSISGRPFAGGVRVA